MPINLKRDYPDNWKQLATEVKTAAQWRCEWCNVPHRTIIERKPGGGWVEILVVWNNTHQVHEDTTSMTAKRLKYHCLTKVVLTKAFGKKLMA